MKNQHFFVLIGLSLTLSACVFVRAPTNEELALLDNPPPAIRQKQDQLTPLGLKWISDVETELLPKGRPLSAVEISIAISVGVKHPDRVRIVILDKFPTPTNQELLEAANKFGLGSDAEGGRTMGYLIMLKQTYAQEQWIVAHELVHIAQQEKMGREAFLQRLIAEYELMGYRRSPLELEANQHALDFM